MKYPYGGTRQLKNSVTLHEFSSADALEVHGWLFHCADNLLRYPVDQAISQILTTLGEAASVDRAWMIEYQSDLLRFCNTHE